MVKVAVSAGGQLAADDSNGGIVEYVKAEDLERMQSYVDYGPDDTVPSEEAVRHLLSVRRVKILRTGLRGTSRGLRRLTLRRRPRATVAARPQTRRVVPCITTPVSTPRPASANVATASPTKRPG